jgi:hypothetical protein
MVFGSLSLLASKLNLSFYLLGESKSDSKSPKYNLKTDLEKVRRESKKPL